MHSFFELRHDLPLLKLDPDFDSCADTGLANDLTGNGNLKKYLSFYQLNFSSDICSKHYVGKQHIDSLEIVIQYWLPAMQSRGTVFFLHGYYDHVGLFHHLIKFLLQQGFSVVAYDQPGHGLSSGEPAYINSFNQYTQILEHVLQQAKLPKPWHFIGQSTGCAVLLQSLLIEKNNNPFERIILLAPLVRPAYWSAGIWLYRLLAPFKKQISRRINQNSNDAAFVDFVHHKDPLQAKFLNVAWVGAMNVWQNKFNSFQQSDQTTQKATTPMLVIQGEADETVDWRYNLAQIKQKCPQASFYRLPTARHHLANERDDIRQSVFSQIKQFLLAST